MRPLIALGLLLSLPVLAQERTSLVVTDFEALGATQLQAEAATGSVVRGLRNLNAFQVLSADEVRQLLAIDRSRELLGQEQAQGEGALSAASKALGARYLVSGSVSRPESRFLVDLRLFDTQEGKVIAQKSLGPVASVETVAQELPGLAQELVSALLEAEQGGLLVTTNEEGVEIWVDDVLRASTPMTAPVRFARGMHRVAVKKDGFIAQTRTVTVRYDDVVTESFVLIPSPDFARTYAEYHGRQRRLAWWVGGFAVASIAGAVGLDVLYSAPTWSRELQPRNFALSGASTETCWPPTCPTLRRRCTGRAWTTAPTATRSPPRSRPTCAPRSWRRSASARWAWWASRPARGSSSPAAIRTATRGWWPESRWERAAAA